MLQDPVFPKDHPLAGYHYSGEHRPHNKRKNDSWKYFLTNSDFHQKMILLHLLGLLFPNLLNVSSSFVRIYLIGPQALIAGLRKKSATSTRGSLPTGRTSLWCRNWYAQTNPNQCKLIENSCKCK